MNGDDWRLSLTFWSNAVCFFEPWKPSEKIKFLESTIDLARLDKLRRHIMEINDGILPKVITMESEKGRKIDSYRNLHKNVISALLHMSKTSIGVFYKTCSITELTTEFFNLIF